MPNRLRDATSPYLLQHAEHPVAWQPWDPEALAQARAEDRPIFLSIGYSACHWCHVMAHESFEDPATAELLNRHFVCVKVDREERPDLDDLYMGAVQSLTGRGGWPMSVWLTPDLEPFFGGTYFPPAPRHGLPGFPQLLERIAHLWREHRADLVRDARILRQRLAEQAQVRPGTGLPGSAPLAGALRQLRASFDPRWGGFGPAPKFPAHMAVEFILRCGTAEDRAMAWRTLDAMWEGGMFDHLGGGFARYSVDERWLVPHFEKMLYDNALLASAYLRGYQVSGRERYAEVARDTLDYLLRDLRDPAGGFWSSEDADSEGVEGRFYVFTPGEVEEELGTADGRLLCEALGIREGGNFEHGTSVLHRFSAPDDLAERHGLKPSELEARLDHLRTRLRLHRDARVRPSRDDKVLAAWNGLALSALAMGHRVLGDTAYLDAASACADFLERSLWRDGQLLRTWRRGTAHTPAFLEDHAALIRGLVDLYEAGFDAHWLRWAGELAEAMLHRFEDGEEGGFFSTGEGQADLLFRQKPGWDGAMPSGNTLAASALLRLSRHLGRGDLRASAERVLACFGDQVVRAPRGFIGMLSVLEEDLRDGQEVVIAGGLNDPRTRALVAEVRRARIPDLLVTLVAADPALPLHAGRGLVGESPTAYVCRGQTCLPPATSAEALAARLSAAP